jgi:hypothetical protein
MDPQKISIPFLLAEAPRTFLRWLALNSTLTDAQRKNIAEWLTEHNTMLAAYIQAEYGHAMMYAANELAKNLGDAFMAQVMNGAEKANKEMFDRLEEELRGDA